MSSDHPSLPPEERYQPLTLLAITLVALAGFAVFFLSFLVAPLAVLVLFYVGFAASDRSKRNGSAARLALEAQRREQTMMRAEPAPSASAAGQDRPAA